MTENKIGVCESKLIRMATAIVPLLGALALQACATTAEPECEAPNYLDANGVCVSPPG